MLKKYVIISLIGVSSISLLWQASSFTAAEINSRANLGITSSEKALIAVPERLEIQALKTKTIEKEILKKYEAEDNVNDLKTEEITEGDFELKEKKELSSNVIDTTKEVIVNNSGNSFTIKNNLPYTLDITIYFEGENNDIRTVTLGKREEKEIHFNFDDIPTKGNSIEYLITEAKWDSGKARIKTEVDITNTTEKEKNNNIEKEVISENSEATDTTDISTDKEGSQEGTNGDDNDEKQKNYKEDEDENGEKEEETNGDDKDENSED